VNGRLAFVTMLLPGGTARHEQHTLATDFRAGQQGILPRDRKPFESPSAANRVVALIALQQMSSGIPHVPRDGMAMFVSSDFRVCLETQIQHNSRAAKKEPLHVWLAFGAVQETSESEPPY
jgi:hypothetical protein